MDKLSMRKIQPKKLPGKDNKLKLLVQPGRKPRDPMDADALLRKRSREGKKLKTKLFYGQDGGPKRYNQEREIRLEISRINAYRPFQHANATLTKAGRRTKRGVSVDYTTEFDVQERSFLCFIYDGSMTPKMICRLMKHGLLLIDYRSIGLLLVFKRVKEPQVVTYP